MMPLMDIGDLELSHDELMRQFGGQGRIFSILVNYEGRAIWIPEFVNWLYKNFEVTEKPQ